jgi:hypothetical protein
MHLSPGIQKRSLKFHYQGKTQEEKRHPPSNVSLLLPVPGNLQKMRLSSCLASLCKNGPGGSTAEIFQNVHGMHMV